MAMVDLCVVGCWCYVHVVDDVVNVAIGCARQAYFGEEDGGDRATTSGSYDHGVHEHEEDEEEGAWVSDLTDPSPPLT